MSNRGSVDGLIAQIDEYLAEQLESQSGTALGSRSSSRGTMFVDWEGFGRPVVSYRNSDTSTPMSIYSYPTTPKPYSPCASLYAQPAARAYTSLCADTNFHVHSSSHRPCVGSFDPETGFEYDYDGRIMHIHHDARPPSPTYSEYYAIAAEAYEGGRALRVVDKELPPLPSEAQKRERRKRSQVAAFIRGLLGRLEKMGVLKQLGRSEARREYQRLGEEGLMQCRRRVKCAPMRHRSMVQQRHVRVGCVP